MVELGDGSSNVFNSSDIGPDGKFYSLWKDGTYVAPVAQTMPSYKLIRWDGSSWTTLSTIAANSIPGMVVSSEFGMLNDRVCLKVDSQGNFHILLHAELSSGENIIYGKSTNNGASWTFTNLENDGKAVNYSFGEPQLDIDQNDRPHVAFRIANVGQSGVPSRVYSVRYYAFNGTSWNGQTVYSQTGGNASANEITGLSFAMDHNGKAHVAFCWETNGSGTDGSLAYMTNASGSWQATPTNLAVGGSSNAAANRVAIAIDGSNNVHIWRRDINFNFYYHTNAGGASLSNSNSLGIQGTFDQQALTTNSLGDVIGVYNLQTSGTNPGSVNYSVKFAGTNTWQSGAPFTGNRNTGQYNSIEFNSSRKAMFLFDHFTDPAGTNGSPSNGSTSTNTPVNSRQLQWATGDILPPSVAPTVITPTSASITAATATLGGDVTADGGATITARGVVFSKTATNGTPQINGAGVTNLTAPGTTGVFTVNASSLDGSTSYSYRAYATNASGTTYTPPATFTTLVANTVPSISVSGDVTVGEGSLATKSGIFSDAQGNGTVTLSVTSGPGTVTKNDTTGTWEWSYTPADGPAGPTLVTITATDNGNPALSASASFNLTVTNVAPVANGATITVLEDSGANPFTLTATDAAGANDTISYSVGALNPPSAGTLGGSGANRTFTPAPDFNGSASFTFTASDEDGGTSAPATVTINVTAVNDAPSLASISPVTVNRNSGAATVNLTGISAGPANEASQSLIITAASSNTAVVPNPTVSYSAGSTGSLSFTPVANQTGVAVITVTVTDNGGTANGGVNSVARTFTVTVRPFSYTAWSEENFTPAELGDPAISGPDANPDGDARVNAWEYALGTKPKQFDEEAVLTQVLDAGSGATRLANYSFTEDGNASDALLTLEASNSAAGPFVALAVIPVTQPVTGTVDKLSFLDDVATTASVTRYARLKLSITGESTPRLSELHATRAVTVNGITGSTPGTTYAGAPLGEPRLALGKVVSVGASTLTLEANQWPSNLLAAGPAYIVITSGTGAGSVPDIVSYASGVLTLNDDLSSVVAAGDTLEVRRHHTIASIFDRPNAGALDGGAGLAIADNVQFALPDGVNFESFYKNTAPGSEGWKDAAAVASDSRVIYPEQAFIVKRKAALTTIFQQGVANSDGGSGNGGAGADPVVPVQTGTNLMISPAQGTFTLSSLGLYTGDPATGVAAATSATNADRILVPQPNGTMKTYFYHPTLGWVNSSLQPAGTLSFPPGTPFYVVRKAPRAPFGWQIP